MDVIETLARFATFASAASLLGAGIAVLVGEARVQRSKPTEQRGGALALVNFAGIAGFAIVGAICALTLIGSASNTTAIAGALRILGIATMLLAGVLAIVGIRTMGRFMASRAEVRPDTPLLTAGPFGLVRHPLYLSILMLWAGGALALLNVVLAAGFVVFIPLLVARARQEEELLTGHFGAAYGEYRRRVPMLLPWPRPRP